MEVAGNLGFWPWNFGTRCAEGILGPVIHMSDKEMWRTLFGTKWCNYFICNWQWVENHIHNLWVWACVQQLTGQHREKLLDPESKRKMLGERHKQQIHLNVEDFSMLNLTVKFPHTRFKLFSKWHPLNSSLLKSCMLPTHRLYKRDTFEPQGHHARDLWAFPAHTSQHWLRASPRRHQSKCVRKHSLGILASDLSKGTEDWLFFTSGSWFPLSKGIV